MKIQYLIWLCALILGVSRQVATSAAAGPETIDTFSYSNPGDAQKAWQAMKGVDAVSPAVIDDRIVLRMPCSFSKVGLERASWDRRVDLDLSLSKSVQFQLLCRNATPVSYFSLYFQSGGGWYHAAFYPESSNDWNSITLDKGDFSAEGQPAGWNKISTIRISAWRGQDEDTEMFLSDFRQVGLLGRDAMVAVLRADSVAKNNAGEIRAVEQYSEEMADAFLKLGVPAVIVSDLDVTAEKLKGARLVILPHNPSMPETVQTELLKYLHTGRMMGFYSLPTRLQQAFGLRNSRHVREAKPGAFSSIRFETNSPAGTPKLVTQHSWNINACEPVPGRSSTIAQWYDQDEKPTGYAALIASSNTLFMSHVLLRGDDDNKRRMLLALAGKLVPDIWKQAALSSVTNMGQISGFKNLTHALGMIKMMNPGKSEVRTAMAAAQAAGKQVRQFYGTGKYPEVLETSAQANRKILEAFCMAQKPEFGEFRAFWCHSAFGVEGLTWDAAIKQLADNGFTAILPNMLWGGAAYYPSQVLPQAKEVTERGDQIAECLAACRKYGLQIHVWKVNWNLGHAVPKEFVENMKQAGRLQADSKGTPGQWLCPSHPENQELEIASMLEVARKYPVDGIHFDYIRYPDSDHCFCGGCRQRFEKQVGKPIQQWPGDVLATGSQRQRWLDWRRDNITKVVKSVSEQSRAIRPGIKISAAVFPRWNTDRDGVGQDWKLWCEKGYLDFVCPMDYTPHNRNFQNQVARQIAWAGKTACYPGIGVSASSSRFGADRTIEQILITRQLKTKGFTIFNYGSAEAKELLPFLGMGVTAKQK